MSEQGSDKEKYRLRCVLCGKEYPDDGFRLRCDAHHPPSLLRSIYQRKTLTEREDLPGMFKFFDWLPVQNSIDGQGKPVTYQSRGLAARLGLKNLFISFNGYWPEQSAFMQTCTFKELEAPPTVARLMDHGIKNLVVASAGNTARAFAQICSICKFPLLLIVPASSLESLWLTEKADDCVKLIALGGDCDYSDSIQLANRLSESGGLVNEGGVMNIARRDGMGATVLDAVCSIGEIPDHYFQAVGSGTGAIAAWEANLRLIGAGSYGSKKMKLHLSQNQPFTPLYSSWKARSEKLLAMDESEAKRRIKQTTAAVLTNRNPPYSIAGGVYEALTDTGGEMYSIDNSEIKRAGDAFENLEGIDICAEASVAVASLEKALEEENVKAGDKILLNITGGGFLRIKQDYKLHQLKPDMVLGDLKIEPQKLLKNLGF